LYGDSGNFEIGTGIDQWVVEGINYCRVGMDWGVILPAALNGYWRRLWEY
jgi:hypothetical protein